MRKVVVFGYFGFGNLGDELLLEALCAILSATFTAGEPEVVVLHRTRKVHCARIPPLTNPVRLVPRDNPALLVRELANCDVAVCAGGLFQDRTSKVSALYYLGVVELARVFRKRVVLLGTEFALSGWVAALGRRILRGCAYVGIRSASEVVRAMREMPGVPVARFPDPCFFLMGRMNPAACGARHRQGESRPVLALRSPGAAGFEHEIHSAVCMLARLGWHDPVLVPFSRSGARWSDAALARRIAAAVPGALVRPWERTDDAPGLFADAQVVIAGRFHAMVLAAMAGIPFVCVSRDPKLTGFAVDWNAPHRSSLDEVDAGTVASVVAPERAWAERREIVEQLVRLVAAGIL